MWHCPCCQETFEDFPSELAYVYTNHLAEILANVEAENVDYFRDWLRKSVM